jgi:AraC-like DNA-binding protein
VDDAFRETQHDALRDSTPAALGDPCAERRDWTVSRRPGLPGCRLRRVLDHIEEHLVDDLRLADLAAVAAMSPHYFSELFTKSMRVTPHRYVLLQRIECAKQRLQDPRSSVLAAALDSGFENASHFARTFRRFVGTTPSEYRAEMLSRHHRERGSLSAPDAGSPLMRVRLLHASQA